MLWHLCQGKSTAEAAEACGFSTRWVQKLAEALLLTVPQELKGGALDPEEDWQGNLAPAGLQLPAPAGFLFESAATAASEEEAKQWKKNLADRLDSIRLANPGAEVELWAEDEARLGLKPVLRRVWAPCGKNTRPEALVRQRYQSMDVFGFVHPVTGRSEWWLLPGVFHRSDECRAKGVCKALWRRPSEADRGAA